MALTPCNESVASLPLESELTSDHKLPSEVSETVQPVRRQQQPAKLSFGGIMISQEVTVDVE
jgi:hypothetical protein